MPKENEEIKVEKKVSMYDPTVDAYREIPISRARQLIKVAKELEEQLGKEEKDE